MSTARRTLLLLSLALACGAVRAESWTRVNESGDTPIRRETDERVELSPRGRVEVRGMGGSVNVTAADVPGVQVHYVRSGATQRDFDCEQLRVESSGDAVRIWTERDRSCHVIRASDQLDLVVPRHADVTLEEIGDGVRVAGVEGMVRLESVGDDARLENVTQLRATSIGDTLDISLARLDAAGIDIDSVGDSVQLRLPRDLGARLQIDSVGGSVRGAGREHHADDGAFEQVLGKGGPRIRINSVGDDVILR